MSLHFAQLLMTVRLPFCACVLGEVVGVWGIQKTVEAGANVEMFVKVTQVLGWKLARSVRGCGTAGHLGDEATLDKFCERFCNLYGFIWRRSK